MGMRTVSHDRRYGIRPIGKRPPLTRRSDEPGQHEPDGLCQQARRRGSATLTMCGLESMAFVRSLSVVPAPCVSVLLRWP